MAKHKKGDAVTRDEAITMQGRAVTFLRNVGRDEDAQDFEGMTLEEYAGHKGLVLNPASKPRTKKPERSTKAMATETLTKADLEDDLTETENDLDGAEQTMDAGWEETLILDSPEYQAMSASEKVEALEDALNEIAEILNGYDPDRFPIDEIEEDEAA